MHHWTDPISRGVYDHPGAMPPLPRPRETNDIAIRVRLLEEHNQFTHYDRTRIERESKDRARDLIAAIAELREEMEPLLTYQLRRAHRAEMIASMASWSAWLGKSGLIALLVLGTVKGWLSPDQAKLFGQWLGLPG